MSTQLKTLTLKCPSCGAALDVTPDMDRFTCGYCGIEQVVKRHGGTVALKLLGDAIARVQHGTDRTAAELTLRRLCDELATLEQERQQFLAWAAKIESDNQGAVVGILVVGVGLCVVLFSVQQMVFGLIALAAGLILPLVAIAANSRTRKQLAEKHTEVDSRIIILQAKIGEQRNLLELGNGCD